MNCRFDQYAMTPVQERDSAHHRLPRINRSNCWDYASNKSSLPFVEKRGRRTAAEDTRADQRCLRSNSERKGTSNFRSRPMASAENALEKTNQSFKTFASPYEALKAVPGAYRGVAAAALNVRDALANGDVDAGIAGFKDVHEQAMQLKRAVGGALVGAFSILDRPSRAMDNFGLFQGMKLPVPPIIRPGSTGALEVVSGMAQDAAGLYMGAFNLGVGLLSVRWSWALQRQKTE